MSTWGEMKNALSLLLFVLLFVSIVPVGQAIDLNGIWKGPNNEAYSIVQFGTAVTLDRYDGLEFRGTLDGNDIRLLHSLDEKDLQGERPEIIKYMLGRELRITAKVLGGEQTIAGQYNDKRVNYESKGASLKVESVTDELHSWSLMRVEPRLRWDDEGISGDGRSYHIDGVTEQVVPVKYDRQNGSLRLVLDGDGTDLRKAVEYVTIKNRLKPIDPSFRATSVTYHSSLLAMRWDAARRVALISFDDQTVLHDLRMAVNQNILDAELSIRAMPRAKATVVRTVNVAHLLLRKIIVFLPGVAGSTISMKINDQEMEVYPRLSWGVTANVGGVQYLKYLECDAKGNPRIQPSSVNLFESYGYGPGYQKDIVPGLSPLVREVIPGAGASLVYNVQHLQEIIAPKNHPKLSVNGRELYYYILIPWAYDWRGFLNLDVDTLLGAGAGARLKPPYPKPPSLFAIRDAIRQTEPFVDEKVILVGHSTGGVILRGALVRPQIADIADKAFFIDVPFFGAPKAYYVFLTGTMDIPFLSASQLRFIAPNLPILYFLAPTGRYPGPVVSVQGHDWNRAVSGAGAMMKLLIEAARARGVYPLAGSTSADLGGIALPEWNSQLEAAAAIYHGAIQNAAPAIGWQNCAIFVSLSSLDKTVGKLWVGLRRGAADSARPFYDVLFESVEGDGTVPMVSQIGDFANHPESKQFRIPGGPLHAVAPNQGFVWERIIENIF